MSLTPAKKFDTAFTIIRPTQNGRRRKQDQTKSQNDPTDVAKGRDKDLLGQITPNLPHCCPLARY